MKTLLPILLFFVLHVSAQERRELKGAVAIGGARVPGVFVINKKTGNEVKTDAQGNFSIMARNGDRLAVHSTFTEDREFYISNDSFKNMPYVLEVEGKATELDEVIIADTVKIVQPVRVKAAYTVAERRFDRGAVTKVHVVPGGIAVNLDPMLNGKEKRRALRRELLTEQQLAVVKDINNIYSDGEIAQTLQIPSEKVEAFIYFAAEDPAVATAVKDNANQAKLLLSEKAITYLKLQLQPENTKPTNPTKNED